LLQQPQRGDELRAAVAGEAVLLDRLIARSLLKGLPDRRNGRAEAFDVLLGEHGGDVEHLAAAHQPLDVARDLLVPVDDRHELLLHVDDDEDGVGAMETGHDQWRTARGRGAQSGRYTYAASANCVGT